LKSPSPEGQYEHLTSFNNLYLPCDSCGGYHFRNELEDTFLSSVQKQTTRIARQIYDGEFKGIIDKDLLQLVSQKLSEAVIQGFGKDLTGVDYETADANMLEALKKDVYHFSAAKNYNQLKDMTVNLMDDNGKIRSFNEFKDICNKISHQYNSQWLQAEYNTAIASGQLAGRWVECEKNSELMPYLQYSTAGDDHVREEHAALDGVIRRIDDDFWNSYYPPNGFNCRCDVIQLPGDDLESTDLSERVLPELDPMFNINLAKEKLVFPPDHPYYEGASAVSQLINKFLKDINAA
jgi:SPP1 gp7 family putative phage head morphogenesis protein